MLQQQAVEFVAPVEASTTASLWSRYRNLILYAFIGGSASALDLGLFSLLYFVLDWPALACHAVSVPVAVVYSFTLNATLNFRTTDEILARLASFAIVSGVGFVSGMGVIWLIEVLGGQSGLIAKVVSLPVVFGIQFLLNSRITFAERELALK
jgi:putative flippase GtrA